MSVERHEVGPRMSQCVIHNDTVYYAVPEDSLFTVEGEISDVHETGLFAYDEGLPIPSRPPLPDPNRAKKVDPVEAANDYDVEESEPPELSADEYEEVRLSDFAEAAEEG